MNGSFEKRQFVRRSVAAGICGVLTWAFPLSVSAQAKISTGAARSSESRKQRRSVGTFRKPSSAKTAVSASARQQDGDEITGVPYIGDPGIKETVREIMRRERSRPKRLFDPNLVEEPPEVEEYAPKKFHPPGELNVPRFPFGSEDGGLLLNSFNPQLVGTSIAGPGRANDGIAAIPPDSVGDVGPTQVLMHANGRIKVYDKLSGALGGLDAADATFWASVSNGVGVSDPRVEYDRLSQRWFLCMINVAATQNRIIIAVSGGPTITNAASFTFFQITTATQFLDYPSLGADANALYVGGNIFTTSTGSFASTRGYVINKANLLGGTLTATVFNGLVLNAASAGPLTPQGVSNDDPAATEGYFIGVDNLAFSLLQIRRVSNPGGVPTLSANISVTVPTTVYPMGTLPAGSGVGVPYQGLAGGRSLDDLDDRLFQAQIVRDNINGVSRLWTAHNIEVNTAGAADTAGNRDGTRWYEIGNLTSTPTLIQSGTLFDPAAANPNSFWIPSISISGQGHAAIGASSAGNVRFPSLFAAGRLRTDALGATQAATQLQSSSTTYNLQGANTKQRWGDYSKTSVDPCDNQSLWHVGEYCDLANSWRMQAVKLIAPAPPATVTSSPSSIANVFTGYNVVVTGVSSAGTEFYDNPAGFTCGPSCSTTGTGTCHIAAAVTASPGVPLTINSVALNSPTQVTLNINTVAATPGTHTIRITNPDGQFTSFNLPVLVPTAAGVSVSGRVVTATGLGIRGALVTLTDLNGTAWTAFTNGFGFYRFDDVSAGGTYGLAVAAKRFRFETRVVSVGDELTNVDFVAR